jgi:peptide/nickel transport system ATP-binding protein
MGPTEEIVNRPRHPYTRGLIDSLPWGRKAADRLTQIPGMMPTLTDIPPGCAFHPRCTVREAHCLEKRPDLQPDRARDHVVACHNLGMLT